MAKNNTVGFSLIEILVIIGLISLVAGVSLGQYSSFGSQKKIEAEALRLSKTLEVARQRVTSGDKSGISNPGSCTLSAGKVTYSATSVSLIATCGSDITIATYQVASGVEMTTSGTVSFQPDGTPVNPACIIVSQSAGGKCRKVIVSISGVVDVGDEELSCTCS